MAPPRPWGEQVKAALKRKNVTQRDAATRFDVHESTISRALKGGSTPIEIIVGLSELAGVTPPVTFGADGTTTATNGSPRKDPMSRNLAAFRAEARLKLQEAAEAAGIPGETLRAYEDAKEEISGKHLVALARVYQRDPDDFDKESPPPRKVPVAPAVHATVIGSIDELLPENRLRVAELQRMALEINASERQRLDEQRAKEKGKRKR